MRYALIVLWGDERQDTQQYIVYENSICKPSLFLVSKYNSLMPQISMSCLVSLPARDLIPKETKPQQREQES